MEGHAPIYRRLFRRGSSPELDSRWQFVQPSRRFGFLEVDPQQTVASLLEDFDEEKLLRSRVAIRTDDELSLNPMLVTDDRLAVRISDFDLVTSDGALVHTAPLFAMDQDLTTYSNCVGAERFLFLVGSMQEYLLFDSLGIAASPTSHLGRLGCRGLQILLHLVDGISEGPIRREPASPPGFRFELDGYLGPEETRPPTMCPVFVGYELISRRRGFTTETLCALQRLFNAEQYLKIRFDQLCVWWPTDDEIRDLEFRRGMSDVGLIKDFFCNLKSLYTIENFRKFLRRERNTDPFVRSLENLLSAQGEAQEHSEMRYYREKNEAAFAKYEEQVDQNCFKPLVESAMNSNDLRIRNLRLNQAHVSRLIQLGMPSIYGAQSQRLKVNAGDERELIPEAKWKQMERLLDVSAKLTREETRIRSRSRRS